LSLECQFIIFQKEKCPESGKEHFQGFVQLKGRKRFNAVKELFGPRVHLERRKGPVKKAIAYCSKDESRVDGPWRNGEANGQGKRKDLEYIQELIEKDVSEYDIACEHFGTWCRNYRAIREFKRMRMEQTVKTWDMENSWYWGEAGAGKTLAVHNAEPDLYCKISGKWFDGYKGQEAVLIDDFTGDMDLSLFLQMLDRFQIRVEVKGGTVPFLAKRVYVTSNLSPEECYPNATAEQHIAIRRRFKTVKKFVRCLK
jgi:hypothetical protein